MTGPALLNRIDQAIAVLVELRAEVVTLLPLAEEDLGIGRHRPEGAVS